MTGTDSRNLRYDIRSNVCLWEGSLHESSVASEGRGEDGPLSRNLTITQTTPALNFEMEGLMAQKGLWNVGEEDT